MSKRQLYFVIDEGVDGIYSVNSVTDSLEFAKAYAVEDCRRSMGNGNEVTMVNSGDDEYTTWYTDTQFRWWRVIAADLELAKSEDTELDDVECLNVSDNSDVLYLIERWSVRKIWLDALVDNLEDVQKILKLLGALDSGVECEQIADDFMLYKLPFIPVVVKTMRLNESNNTNEGSRTRSATKRV